MLCYDGGGGRKAKLFVGAEVLTCVSLLVLCCVVMFFVLWSEL
jgi:hypothetical protein